MQHDSIQMGKLKRIELEMLDEFVNICKQLGVKYYIIGGTLLGAVRHKGFIPWDDDIDIGMLREDYEIFVSKASKLLPDTMFLQNYRTDKNMIFPFTKIRYNNSTYIESKSKYSKMNQGVWIDIFPLDFYEKNPIKRKWNDICISLINIRVGEEEFFDENQKHSWIHTVIKCICKLLVDVRYPNLKDAVKKIDEINSSGKKNEMVLNNSGSYGDREVVPMYWFDEGKLVKFEDRTLSAPKHYDEYLHQIYGDYMIPPPKEKQISVHDIEVIDLDNPYTNYLKE